METIIICITVFLLGIIFLAWLGETITASQKHKERMAELEIEKIKHRYVYTHEQ